MYHYTGNLYQMMPMDQFQRLRPGYQFYLEHRHSADCDLTPEQVADFHEYAYFEQEFEHPELYLAKYREFQHDQNTMDLQSHQAKIHKMAQAEIQAPSLQANL